MKAIPKNLGTKFLDQTVPECDDLGRPDLVILIESEKKAYLVDVALPCGTQSNLEVSRARKVDIHRYQGNLEEKGYTTVLDPLLVGTLGTWDPKNDLLLKQLGIGRKHGNLFKKLRCRDVIAGSYDVWASRCVGIFAGK